jgi:macrolide-specific efflux system membrane fusion protein
VTAISKVATVADGVADIPVTVSITGSPSGLYSGVSADVSITTFDKANVLTVPTSAVHTVGTRSFVYELVGGKEVMHTVTVGAQGTSVTQIKSGLTSGTEIVESIVSATVPSSSTNSSSSRSLLGGSSSTGGFSGGGTPPSGGFSGGR